jgi:hypothetical protein
MFWLEDAAFSPTLIYMEDDRLNLLDQGKEEFMTDWKTRHLFLTMIYMEDDLLSLLDQVEEDFMIWLKDAAFVPYFDLHGRRSPELT